MSVVVVLDREWPVLIDFLINIDDRTDDVSFMTILVTLNLSPPADNTMDKMLVISMSTEYDVKRAQLFDGINWTPLTKFKTPSDMTTGMVVYSGAVHYHNRMYFYNTDISQKTTVFEVATTCSVSRLGVLPFNYWHGSVMLTANGHIYACFETESRLNINDKSFCHFSTDPLFQQFNVTAKSNHAHPAQFGLAASEGLSFSRRFCQL